MNNWLWKKYLCLALLVCIWTLINFLWQYSRQIPSDLEGKTIALNGEIVSDPIIKQNSVRFLFDTKKFGIVQLDWYRNAPEMKKNQRWQLNVRLKRPRNYKNPGGFNYERYLFLKRISATGYVDVRGENKLLYAPAYSLDIRQTIAQQIDQALAQRPNAALIKGLAVGIRDTMTDDQWELLQKTGTSHLLAISGLHIGLVSGLVFFLVRKFWAFIPHLPLRIPAPTAAAISAIVAAAGYALLAGFSVPTQRALIMISVLMLSIIARYRFKNRDILFFAGVLVAFWDPFALFSASFWLSFIAVALLLILSLQQGPKWSRLISVQWFISLGLTPLVIFYFQQISWVAPLANFLAIPWASFTVVPLTLLGVIASWIDLRLAALFWLLAESALNYLNMFLKLLADLPGSAQSYIVTDARVWMSLVLGSLLLLLPRAVPGKLLGLLLLSALFWVRYPKPGAGEVWLTILDVGQGLAVVVQTAQHVLLYDAGMRFDSFDLGAAVIRPFLQHQGITEINTLVLSHDNLDHTGGAAYLIAHMPVHNLISGEAITDLDIKQRCVAGQSWVWDKVHFSFLYPYAASRADSNDRSCVLKISTGAYSALLTGDIEKYAEVWLIEQASATLKTNILLAPHHGSRTSSSLPFVQLTDPDHVIFSTGYKNRYGFPRADIVSRYAARGAHVHNTAEGGAISFKFSAQGVVTSQ